MVSLKGKGIIITGASKGLGSVCAEVLSRQGTNMVLIARSEEKLEMLRKRCKNPSKHLSIAQDLTDIAKLQSCLKKAKEFLGKIDVVLHVVGGGLGLRDPLVKSEDFIKLFKLNVTVASEINRIVLPEMIKRKKGNLVHIGSIASSEATGSVGYNSVKAALAAYVRSLGREVAGSGVVVTGIMPGGFYAPENSWRRLEAQKPEAVKRFIEERLPRGYMAKAEELIPMIFLLCSDDASMMTGCMVPIDAGEGKSYLNL